MSMHLYTAPISFAFLQIHVRMTMHVALQDAVYAARASGGHKGWFQLHSPATPERLRMACVDQLTQPFAGPDYVAKGSF